MTPAQAIPARLRAMPPGIVIDDTNGDTFAATTEWSDEGAIAVAMLPELIALARGVASGVVMTETARQLVARLDTEVPS